MSLIVDNHVANGRRIGDASKNVSNAVNTSVKAVVTTGKAADLTSETLAQDRGRISDLTQSVLDDGVDDLGAPDGAQFEERRRRSPARDPPVALAQAQCRAYRGVYLKPWERTPSPGNRNWR